MRVPARTLGALIVAVLALVPAIGSAEWRWPTDARGRLVPAEHFPCHEPRIEGRVLRPIGNPPNACGIAVPVEARALTGVRLSTPTRLSCPAARRVARWLDAVVQPTARRVLGTSVERLVVSGGYVCRTRNFEVGGPLSQHAFGRALDIAAFGLSDGRSVSILTDWGKGDAGIFLSLIHRQACAMFGTVLGPEADLQHRDHLHLDIAPRRRGYCR
ncbi:MAG: extensin family protein [Pseudomonadota bacterium]